MKENLENVREGELDKPSTNKYRIRQIKKRRKSLLASKTQEEQRDNLSLFFSAVGKAYKKGSISRNKQARLMSRASKKLKEMKI